VNQEQPARLEIQTIQPISPADRHGTARDLFTVWFGSNLMLLTIITGALAVTSYKLPFAWATTAIVFGNLAGGVFMALHAAQGPTLGVPQMVQTRGQFGSLGALLVVGVVIVMYVGFFASNLVVGGQAIEAVAPRLHHDWGIVLMGVISVLGAILGYDLIHAYARVVSYVSGAVLALAFAWILAVHGLPADFGARGAVTTEGVLGTVSAAALWQIAYAPYVSDYSRYMPAGTGARGAFWASYWGCTLGSILPMILGVVIALCIQDDKVIGGLGTLTDRIAPFVLAVFAIGMIVANAMNIYCGALSTLTFGQTLLPRWSPHARARSVTSVVLLAIALVLALRGSDSFLKSYTVFIDALLYVLVPWTAINLVDYYLVHHGRYDVESFLRVDGGIYGRVNSAAVACYLLGIVVQIPFMSTTLYTGIIAHRLGGADVSWIVGLVVTSPVYYWLAGLSQARRDARLAEARQAQA
jgi:NCS1 family nucleobase:cation symporter-1